MRLKIERFGQSAEGIRLSGNRKACEPDHVRIAFSGGDVEVVRAKDGDCPDYWVHIRVNRRDEIDPDEGMAADICDARLDQSDKPSSEANMGDFNRPALYHLAGHPANHSANTREPKKKTSTICHWNNVTSRRERQTGNQQQ
jgi:hypothetical protein